MHQTFGAVMPSGGGGDGVGTGYKHRKKATIGAESSRGRAGAMHKTSENETDERRTAVKRTQSWGLNGGIVCHTPPHVCRMIMKGEVWKIEIAVGALFCSEICHTSKTTEDLPGGPKRMVCVVAKGGDSGRCRRGNWCLKLAVKIDVIFGGTAPNVGQLTVGIEKCLLPEGDLGEVGERPSILACESREF